MSAARKVAVPALMTALLVAIQYLLSFVKGAELVTVFFIAFCFSFGIVQGIAVAVSFSLLRCFLFGFFPQVILLYLIHYPILAVVSGLAGKLLFKRKNYVIVISSAVMAAVSAAVFNLLDDLVTPLMLGFSVKAWKAYFYASLPVMGIQAVFCAVSSAVLFYPLCRIFGYVKKSEGKKL